jgi:cytochrome c-type biogenesis protein CcmH/NrfG
MPAPWIFTFYSYKGGVGRSQAALNVAYTLAGWGRHVLLVDMDLEAPGLSGFLARAQELDPPAERQPDVLTLLEEIVLGALRGDASQVDIADIPPVSNYIRAVDRAKLSALAPKMGELGRLDVLGANLGEDYSERLAHLNLHDLAHDQLLDASRLLGRYFKAQRFAHRPFWLESFEPALSTGYDYIIVDSRTGLTEIGGLCVGPLADRLVVFTGLNDQNVEGTLAFLREVGIDPVARLKDHDRWDDSDKSGENSDSVAALGPKPTILVASPVPAGEIEAKRKRLTEIERRLGMRPEQISYHPQLALMETLFVRDYQEEYLAVQYRTLTDRIQALVGDDSSHLVGELNAWLTGRANEIDPAKLVATALRVAPLSPPGRAFVSLVVDRIGSNYPILSIPLLAVLSRDPMVRPRVLSNWGVALWQRAQEKVGSDADLLFASAFEKFAEALKLKPDYPEALYNFGCTLSEQATAKEGAEADRLFGAAYEKYAEALKINPDYTDVLSSWGVALSDQANMKEGEEADRLFAAASEKFAEALRLRPDFSEALNNWGIALLDQAKSNDGGEADRLFVAASEKFAAALKPKPNYPEALSNWGNALSDQAKAKQGEEADRLFAEAYERYAKSLTLKPNFPEALNNWGRALSDQAEAKEGEEADRLFTAAYDMYTKSLRLKPNFPEALNNWGIALSAQARMKEGEEADRFLAAAAEKYTAAHKLSSDS